MIEELAGKEGGEDFKTFWEAFGRNLKIGVIEVRVTKQSRPCLVCTC